jgi:hypothetical protein
MADDHRYSWLDDKAAERLLRGEPVEGQHGAPDNRNDRPHAEAERLAAVLGAVAEAPLPGRPAGSTVPLPGEEAAVAAFRAAQAKPTVVPISAEAQVGDKSTRIARPRGLRRLRAGMVAAVAGCALSGFAVAAAAGVLPFGQSGGTPGPGASVSETGPGPGKSVRPEISEEGGASTTPGGRTSDGTQGRGVPGGDEGHGKGKHGKYDGHGEHGKYDGHGKPGKGEKGSPAACRRYLASEAGTGPDVGKAALKKLTSAAGSPSGIHDYCVQRVGDDAVPRSGTNGVGSTSGASDTGSASDSGSGDDGGSSHPSPPPPSDTSSGDGGGTPSPEPTPSGTPSSSLSGTSSGGKSSSSSGTSSGAKSSSSSGTPSTTPSGAATPAESGAS